MYKTIPVVIVVAMAKETRAIGRENGLLWDLPEDRKRFRDLTRGHPVILGRKTFESIVGILGKPLPDRPNIVVSRNGDYAYDGVEVVDSLEAALEAAYIHNPSEIHIGGGSQIYEQALPLTDRLHLTLVDDTADGDAHFPGFEDSFEIDGTPETKTENGITYSWVDFVRKENE